VQGESNALSSIETLFGVDRPGTIRDLAFSLADFSLAMTPFDAAWGIRGRRACGSARFLVLAWCGRDSGSPVCISDILFPPAAYAVLFRG